MRGESTGGSLITGGAGFIGCNLAERLLARGERVTVLDALTRPGTSVNLEWLQRSHGDRLRFVQGDVRDFDTVRAAVAGSESVYHLAGQTAVTSSLADPRADFEANALGTLNVLEAVRAVAADAVVVYSSTNKVYGALEHLAVVEEPTRFRFADRPDGVTETEPLDFHSPYGCSKGAADQYVRDYARVYGLRTVVFRQSCVYGPRQLGTEDQGWVAWFMLASATNRPVTIAGNGKQVRDLLYIDDLLDAYDAARRHAHRAAGQVYNLGGGAANAISIWREFAPVLAQLLGGAPEAAFEPWRRGDQRIFVADTAKAQRELGWAPRVGIEEGLRRLADWVTTAAMVAGAAGS
jgi:CDP-paratose 2-epimerase